MLFRMPSWILLASLILLTCSHAAANPSQRSAGMPSRGIPSDLKPPAQDLEQLEEPETDDAAGEKPYHIPMILNSSVENHLEYFKTRGREHFQRWLDRSAR